MVLPAVVTWSSVGVAAVTVHDLSALKSYDVPLIVRVLVVGTPPNPDNVYVGILRVLVIKVADPEFPVVVRVIALCFELNVLQSVELKAPLLVAEAVGTFNVITGVVVPVATVLVISVPVVPIVNAETDVTVPTLQVLSALKSKAVPLIVKVLEVGTPPSPDNV